MAHTASQNAGPRDTAGTRSPMPSQASSMNISEDLWDYFQTYAREKPEVVTMWAFGIGFVLGWKLKPW